MAIIKEWRCAAHGEFEGPEGICPRGCPKRFVVQEIRTPPAYHDGRTANIDRTLDGLADSVGLTDLSNRNGSVMNSQRKSQGPDFSPRWFDIPHATPGWSQREGEKSPVVMAGEMGMQPANVVDVFSKAGVIGAGAEDFHGRGPSLAASKEANLLVGVAKREELE
jgi:hypothetical protein